MAVAVNGLNVLNVSFDHVLRAYNIKSICSQNSWYVISVTLRYYLRHHLGGNPALHDRMNMREDEAA